MTGYSVIDDLKDALRESTHQQAGIEVALKNICAALKEIDSTLCHMRRDHEAEQERRELKTRGAYE